MRATQTRSCRDSRYPQGRAVSMTGRRGVVLGISHASDLPNNCRCYRSYKYLNKSKESRQNNLSNLPSPSFAVSRTSHESWIGCYGEPPNFIFLCSAATKYREGAMKKHMLKYLPRPLYRGYSDLLQFYLTLFRLSYARCGWPSHWTVKVVRAGPGS